MQQLLLRLRTTIQAWTKLLPKRYSLRVLFLVVTLIAPLMYYAAFWQNKKEQRLALQSWWESIDLTVLDDENSEPYMVLAFGSSAFDKHTIKDLKLPNSIKKIVVRNCRLNDCGIVGIDMLPRLELLVLDGTLITDRAIKTVVRCENLKYLNIMNTEVSDASVELLSSMKQLKGLYIEGTDISEAGAKILGRQMHEVEIEGPEKVK